MIDVNAAIGNFAFDSREKYVTVAYDLQYQVNNKQNNGWIVQTTKLAEHNLKIYGTERNTKKKRLT